MQTQTSIRGPLLVLAGALCFSISGFLQAIAPDGSTPYSIACSRMMIGAAALFLFNQIFRGGVKWSDWPWKAIAICSVCLWFYQILFFNSILTVGVAVGTVVAIGVTPIFSGIIDFLISKKTPQGAWYLATLMAIVGLVLINMVGGVNFDWGDLLMPIAAGACYAMNICTAPRLTVKHTAEESMMMIMAVVGIGLLPLALYFPNNWLMCVRGLGVALALGVVTGAAAFSLTVAGIKSTATPVAATLALGEPMGAALLGILALGEPCTLSTIIGIALILLAVLVLIYAESKAKYSISGVQS